MKSNPFCNTIILCTLVLILGTGCSNQKNNLSARERLTILHSEGQNPSQPLSTEKLIENGEEAIKIFNESSNSNFSVAEDLVNSGLSNLSFEALDESLMFFEMALKKDRGNEKALLYLSILEPLKIFKGFYWRNQESNLNWVDSRNFYSYLLSSQYRTEGASFERFLSTPYRDKFKSIREIQTEIANPLSEILSKNEEYFDILLSNPSIDVEIKLPTQMISMEETRLRHADISTLRTFYRFLYIENKLLTTYQGDTGPIAWISKDLSYSEIIERQIKDPVFGLLTDPHIFEILQKDFLGLINSINLATEELLNRLITNENDSKDLFQCNGRQFNTCYGQDPLYLINLKYSNSDSLKCNYFSVFETPVLISRRNTYSRQYFESTHDFQSILTKNELNDYVNMYENSTQLSKIKTILDLTKKYLLGPVEESFNCYEKAGHFYTEKIWVDYPSYMKNPILDFKKQVLRIPENASDLNEIQLQDPTFHGLYKPHIPCYKFQVGKNLSKRNNN